MRRFTLRGHERIRHLHELSVNAPERGRKASGYAIDISHSGTKIFTKMSLAAGDLIELTQVGRTPPVTLGGRVVYVTTNDDGVYAGVRFHQPLDPAAFRKLT